MMMIINAENSSCCTILSRLFIFTKPSVRAGYDTRSILSGVLQVWIQSFPSVRLVVSPRLKKPVYPNIYVMLWPSTRSQKMLFQGDAPEGSDTFQWPVIERDRVDGLRLILWDKVKVPLCQYRLMHRKRVTSELHDSYFRLMTIKHSISKIEWASNDYIIELSSTSQSSCQEGSRQLETKCGRESHTRPRGPSETPMEFEVQRRCW